MPIAVRHWIRGTILFAYDIQVVVAAGRSSVAGLGLSGGSSDCQAYCDEYCVLYMFHYGLLFFFGALLELLTADRLLVVASKTESLLGCASPDSASPLLPRSGLTGRKISFFRLHRREHSRTFLSLHATWRFLN